MLAQTIVEWLGCLGVMVAGLVALVAAHLGD
jgi:hypothetical protein